MIAFNYNLIDVVANFIWIGICFFSYFSWSWNANCSFNSAITTEK